MSIALVQRKYSVTLSSGSPSQVTTFDDATANGNLILVTCYWRGLTTTVDSVTDDAGNTFYRAGDAQIQPDGYDNVDVWYAYGITGKASHAVTVTLSGTTSWWIVSVSEWSGALATAAVFDQSTGSASGVGETPTEWTVGTLTPPTDGALIFVPCYASVTVIATEPTPQTAEITDYSQRYCYYYVQPTAATYTAEMSGLSASAYCGKVLTFLATAPEVWVPVPDFHKPRIDAAQYPGGVARCLCSLWAREAGVMTKARLVSLASEEPDVVDAVVGTSAEVTSQTPTDATFAVTLTGNKVHRLEQTSDTPESDLFCAPGAKVAP